MNNYIKSIAVLLISAVAVGAASLAAAAEVRVGLSTRETYVGLPVTLRIQVENATKMQSPIVPNIDGVVVKSLGTPSQSSQVTIINGRTSSTTTRTFAYELTPQRSGTFKIPPIAVNVDGDTKSTRAVEFVASRSETGDLLFVEIAGKEKQIYVGQALDVTLKIWIRPYTERKLKLTLSPGNMWQLMSDRSEWGPFSERLQHLLENDQPPVGKEVLRKDASGVEHSYYLYELDATIYPKRPGTIDGDNVKIVVNYPTSLGRSRGIFSDFFGDMPGGRPGGFDDDDMSPFSGQLTVQTVRPLVAQAVVEPINVLPIPTAGRPADYRGAVGKYQIAVNASPTSVKSGDPINLIIGVAGTGPMELVQAPPLAELPKLTTEFKVPNEPLAGFVKGDQKMFSTTIRPRKQGITEIPPIPFSYFDPTTAKFATTYSKPMPITVEKADMLALDSVEHSGPAAAVTGSRDGSTPAGNSPVLAIFSGDNVLAKQTPWRLSYLLVLSLLTAPPIAVVVLALARSRSILGRPAWFSSSVRRTQRAIDQSQNAAEVVAALKSFVARQLNIRGATSDAEKGVGAIRAAGHRSLAIRYEQLLNACATEPSVAPFGNTNALDDLKRKASQWVEDWQLENQRLRHKPIAGSIKPTRSVVKTPTMGSTGSAIVVAVLTFGTLFATGQAASAQSVELNGQQQQSLLNEADDSYNAALRKVETDSAEAKQGFADAAEKYQLLVRAGVESSQLYFNLGNAYLECGQNGKAIANYLHSLRIDPTMREAQLNLAHARKLVQSKDAPATEDSTDTSLASVAMTVNSWLTSHIGPSTIFAVAAIAWVAMWVFVGLRVAGHRLPWKMATLAASLVCVVAGVSSLLTSQAADQHLAVVVQPTSANVDGAKSSLTTGQVVEIVQERSDSTRVRTSNGETVWLPTSAVEAI